MLTDDRRGFQLMLPCTSSTTQMLPSFMANKEIHAAMSAHTKWNTSFWFWVALRSCEYLKATMVCLYQGAYIYKIKYVFGGAGRCIYSPIWVFANMEKQVFV